MKVVKQFVSYEGEGPRIGAPTTFFTYDKKQGEDLLPVKTKMVYINCEEIDSELLKTISEELQYHLITIELDIESFFLLNEESLYLNVFFLIRVSKFRNSSYYEQLFSILKNNFVHASIKIEAEKHNFVKRIELAKLLSQEKNLIIFVMPLFTDEVGEMMMKVINDIPDNVRIMPPTQLLINMK